MPNETIAPVAAVTPDGLLAHWQGHRRVTRRMIEAYPEDKLFTYSIGGMRTFGQLSLEIVTMGAAMVRGTVTGEWENNRDREPRPKAEVLQLGTRQRRKSTSCGRRFRPRGFRRRSRRSECSRA